ncbi:hypothetical protein NB493_05815 [Vibrio alginolyticus]|nr:hypothetical protein [Vibrio alginolyticus]
MTIYQDFFRAKVIGAITEAKAASKLTHQGVKGTILEILISKLFRPLLPADIGVGTGQVVEQATGKVSNQIDIILYDKSVLPPVLFDESTGIFPVEAVLYAIEVKTKLTMKDLRIANASAAYLASFTFLHGFFDQQGNGVDHPVIQPISVLFGLDSTLTGNRQSEPQRYQTVYVAGNQPPIKAICIAGKGYAWVENHQFWREYPASNDYDEILAFIGGVTNTYKTIAASRGRPSLGHYIVPNKPIVRGISV